MRLALTVGAGRAIAGSEHTRPTLTVAVGAEDRMEGAHLVPPHDHLSKGRSGDVVVAAGLERFVGRAGLHAVAAGWVGRISRRIVGVTSVAPDCEQQASLSEVN